MTGLMTVVLLAAMAILEGGLRFYFWVRQQVAPPDRATSAWLGWAVDPDQHWERELPGFGRVVYTTGPDGFRRRPVPRAGHPRLWVIGDSTTQAATVSDGMAYYDRLAEALPQWDVYAYGAGGYGSLQEMMILEKFKSQIDPDLILWQFCGNDLINNSWPLESASLFNNQMTRPYLVEGRMVWRYPNAGKGASGWLTQYSYLLRVLNVLSGQWQRGRGASIEARLQRGMPLLEQSIATTVEIMRRARRAAAPAPIVAFTIDDPPWAPGVFDEICEAAGIEFIPGVPAVIEAARTRGEAVDGEPYDSHWNALGHELAAQTILEGLRPALQRKGADAPAAR